MTSLPRYAGLGLALLMAFSAMAFAQNTRAADAAFPSIGQLVTFSLDTTTTARWYLYYLRAGRSYCVEATMSGLWAENGDANPRIQVIDADGITPILSSSDMLTEPAAFQQARACWIAPSPTLGVYVAASQEGYAVGHYHNYDMRLVETTLWCPWFFVDGDYNAFTLLRNTTNAAVNVTVTWRSATGTVVGTYTGSIPGNGNLALNARTYVTGATSGGIEVAHTGSPQAIQGSTTTLSGTTGVGFDATFTQRLPW